MAENQVYLIKSGQNSFVEETNAIIGIDNAGRVGIGTTAPEADFHVTGDTQIDGNLTVKGDLTTVDSTTIQVDDKNIELGVGSTTDAAADGGGITLHGASQKTFNWVDATDAWTSSENLHLAAGKRFSADAIRALGAAGLSVGDDAGNGIFIENGGSVGIGTATPAYDLDVDGSGSFSNSLYVGGYKVYTTNDGSWKWQDSGDDIYYTAGKVGVANDSPAYNLHVSGDSAVDGNFIVNGESGNFNVSELNVSGDYVHVNYLSDDLASNRGGLQVHAANGTGKLEYLSDTNHWQFNKKLEVLGDVGVQNNLTIGGLISNNAFVENNFTVGNNLTVSGNFEVKGTTTTVNTQTVTIEDHNLVIASNTGYNQLTAEYPNAGGGYAGLFWGTGDNGDVSPVSLTYQHNKGFNFTGAGVGIGVDHPAYDLDVAGTGNFSSAVQAPLMLQNGNTVVDQGDVGSEPNQIPLNKDLGSLAYMDAPEIEDLNVDTLELREIDSEFQLFNEAGNPVDAVDVFVYDTRKDSDGGAWRSRTQHTSWYNEELNTATRGGRREFPAVAVIVAEASKVIIYDGDDPDLPMWMIWEESGVISWASGTTTTQIPIAALNAKFVWGTDGKGGGIADFIKDEIEVYHGAIQYELKDKKIASRSNSSFVTGNGYSIIDTITNDVAMTVLPNAPIDAETGLPIPTIAVATGGGVSVIKDDGSVVDISDSTWDNVINIIFNDANRIFVNAGTAIADGALVMSFNIPTTDNLNIVDDNETIIYYRKNHVDTDLPWYKDGGSAGNHNILSLSKNKEGFSFGSEDDGTTSAPGLKLIDENTLNPEKGMLCAISSRYNTGWMPGDIKLATLSDTKIEKVGVDESTELVTNNEFATDSDWIKPVEWTIPEDGTAVASNASSTLYQIVDNLTIGQTYKISINVLTITSGSVSWRAASKDQGGALDLYASYSNTGVHEIVFKADATSMVIGVIGISSFSGTIGSVSLTQTGELITNGTFDNGITGWTDNSDSDPAVGSSVVGAELVLTGTGGAAARIYQELDTVIGKTYTISYEVISLTATIANFKLGSTTVTSSEYFNNNISSDGVGVYSRTFVATAAKAYLNLYASNGSVTLDNVSVRLAEEDRSVNDNGLQIFGEIDKTPVAPGADLVAYSGFSVDNYLMQPYNSDLDFGTGDFCIMGWVNLNSQTSNKHIFAISDGQGSTWGNNGYIACKWNGPSTRLEFSYAVGGLLFDENFSNSGWQHVTLLRKDGVIKMYTNSRYIDENSSSASLGITNSDSHMVLGAAYYNSSLAGHLNYYLSLFRVSKTAPTPEQIAKIYHDEKALFTDGAQATLYGTSDAVTALAYDDKTELLHVGTSSGRSDFAGLRRINNTTTAVTTSISASNNLIAEQ